MLRNERFNHELVKYIKHSDDVNGYLVNKRTFDTLLIGAELRKIHERIRLQIKNKRRNGLTAMLRSYLYEMMPESEEQRQYFKSFEVTLKARYPFKLSTVVR